MRGLNSPLRRKKLEHFARKERPDIMGLQETHLISKDQGRLKLRGFDQILHASGHGKTKGAALAIRSMVDFRVEAVTRDKEGRYLVVRGKYQDAPYTIAVVYGPNSGQEQFLLLVLKVLEEQSWGMIVLMGDLNIAWDRERDRNGKSMRGGGGGDVS